MNWEEITNAVRYADWGYNYANDARAHREGRASMVKMRDAVSYGHELCPETMEKIWTEHAPKGRKYPLADRKGSLDLGALLFVSAIILLLFWFAP